MIWSFSIKTSFMKEASVKDKNHTNQVSMNDQIEDENDMGSDEVKYKYIPRPSEAT